MFNIAQFLLELCLIGLAILVLSRKGWPAVHRQTLWIVTLGSVATNVAVFAAGFDTLLKLSGGSWQALYVGALFQVAKWAVVAYIFTRLALTLRRDDSNGGFALLDGRRSPVRILVTGAGIAVVAVIVVILMALVEQALGLMPENMWSLFQEKAAAIRPLIFWAGLRNLVGEEIMPQLGVQTLILFHASRHRWAGIASILGAALFFELWHDGFQNLAFYNFTFGLFFAYAYRRHGYETAAVAHCCVDWLLYLALPLFLT